jgi:caffeoyl-CoA O-methyltransferase
MTNSPKSLSLTTELHDYLVAHGTPPDAIQRELIVETERLGGVSVMQIAPEQGAFMTVLTRAIGARRTIEVGTFTGYSTLCTARGLGEGGRVIACDVSEEWTTIARRYWEKAGVADKIDLRIGPASETLGALPADPVFDLGFIDADKTSYADYYGAGA